jgi:hypothetical protein
MNITNLEDKIVGLYYDQSAKERQELIKVNLFDVTPIIDIDNEVLTKSAKMSILNDIEIVRHFISILTKPEDSYQNLTLENKVLVKQLNIHILKSLTHMINVGGEDYLKLL